jgi:hypothetical protein
VRGPRLALVKGVRHFVERQSDRRAGRVWR